jgi:PAS domain S-box-containing protein
MIARKRVRSNKNNVRHSRVWQAFVFAFAFTFSVPVGSAHAQGSTRRVLLLFSYNITYPGIMSAGQGAIDRLRAKSPEKLELLSEFLDLARFPGSDHESRTAQYLTEKYAVRRPDVVITAGREASQFILKYRDAIAPDVPVVACCMSADTFASFGGSSKITGIVSGRDISKTLDLAEQLQPSAQNLVVIAGATDFDRQWAQIARQEIESRERRYDVRYFIGLPYDALIEEVSHLQRNTIAITLTYFADDSGGRYVSADVIQGVAEAASAPVYSPYPTRLGFGLVGGYSDLDELMGAQTADLALEILSGKDPNAIAPQLSTAGAYRVDERQLKRWQLSEANLPAGAVVSFREATLWDEHRYLILSVLAVLGLQSGILAYVLAQNRRRRIAETSLAESEERMAIAAASTNIGLWQFQNEDRPIWATEHCRFLLGLAENTPLRLDTLRESIHPDDRRALVKAMREAASGGHPIDSEFRIVLPDNETRWIAIKGYPRRNENEGPYYVNGILSDVTALKKADSEAELQRREIGRLMRQSILGQLSGAIAHELNQPLTAILTNAETAQDLLSRQNIDLEKIREIVTDIIEEDNRAGEVIVRVRNLLRKGESKSELIDLNKLVESTLRLLRGEIVKRKIPLELTLAVDLPAVFGDPVQLQQVLLNVIMNAMEAMNSKAPSQRAMNIATRANGGQVEAVIVDTGHGIAAEDQIRLFMPFFTTKEQGLGLGLSICSTIVKSHGGKLSIENTASGGAIAVVALPALNNVVAA